MSKTFEQFWETLKDSNIDPSFYYTNYEKVAEHLNNFENVLNQIGIVNSDREFIEKFRTICKKDPKSIIIFPLFTGVRPDAMVVLKEGKEPLKKITKDNITFNDAINFLKEVGFLERINELAPFDTKAYFYGVNVGLDSHGRKNRSGKQMERLVGTHLKGAQLDFIEQATIKKVNERWGVNFVSTLKKQKKYDFVVKGKTKFYFIETNFFNSKGSKTDINTRFIQLKPHLEKISKDIEFIVITDGRGLSKTEVQDLFAKLKNVWNIDDLENGIANTLK